MRIKESNYKGFIQRASNNKSDVPFDLLIEEINAIIIALGVIGLE